MIETAIKRFFCQCRLCGRKQCESPAAFRRASQPRCTACGGGLDKVGAERKQNGPTPMKGKRRAKQGRRPYHSRGRQR